MAQWAENFPWVESNAECATPGSVALALLSLSWTRWAEWFCAAAHRCEAIVRRLLLKEAKSSLGEAEWGEPDLEAYTQFCSAAEEARTTTSTLHTFSLPCCAFRGRSGRLSA